jgi:hypothetical protein
MVEYFCKTCTGSVCVKCIYDDHNGHQLMQVEEMGNDMISNHLTLNIANSVKQNVIDLRKMIDSTKRQVEDNAKMVETVKEELARLLEQ